MIYQGKGSVIFHKLQWSTKPNRNQTKKCHRNCSINLFIVNSFPIAVFENFVSHENWRKDRVQAGRCTPFYELMQEASPVTCYDAQKTRKVLSLIHQWITKPVMTSKARALTEALIHTHIVLSNGQNKMSVDGANAWRLSYKQDGMWSPQKWMTLMC